MKKNNKVNIIDIGVVLIILLFAAGLGVRLFSTSSQNAKETKKYEVVAEVENIRDFSVEALSKLGALTDEKNTRVIGEIISSEAHPYELQTVNSRGKAVIVTMPHKNKCIVTLHVDGKEMNNRYFIDEKTELAPGRNIDIITKYVKTGGTITSVKELD